MAITRREALDYHRDPRPGKIEVVPTTANYPEINVAICELKTSQSSATLTELIRALTDDQAKAVFAKYGYAKSK